MGGMSAGVAGIEHSSCGAAFMEKNPALFMALTSADGVASSLFSLFTAWTTEAFALDIHSLV